MNTDGRSLDRAMRPLALALAPRPLGGGGAPTATGQITNLTPSTLRATCRARRRSRLQRMIERGTLGVSRSSVPLRLDRRLPRRSSLSVMMTKNSPRGARARFGDSLPSSRSGSQNTTEAPEAEAERREGGRRRTLGGRGTSRMVEREREERAGKRE